MRANKKHSEGKNNTVVRESKWGKTKNSLVVREQKKTNLGKKKKKTTPPFRPPPPQGPPLSESRGVRKGGLGYSLRITCMILEVKSSPKIFDSMGIRRINKSYPPKILWPPNRGG